ncbi:MAG: ABC transporter permease [Rhodothermales bacterium]
MTDPHPPKLAAWLLDRMVRNRRHSEFADDLHDLFDVRVAERGEAYARWRFWRDTLSICARRSLRHDTDAPLNTTTRRPIMFKHYTITALRNLRRQAGYAFINVFGLAIGLAACLLIGVFVQHEWSFDAFHADSDRLYRAWVLEDYGPDEQFLNTITPLALGETLVDLFPEVEASARVLVQGAFVHEGSERLPQQVHVVDPTFFDLFSFPLVYGDPARALAHINTIVLTETAARQYFGQANPMGQTVLLQLDDAPVPFTVTGVAQDFPAASSIQAEVLVPYAEANYSENARTSWFNVMTETYVLLREGTTAAMVEAKMPELSQLILGDRYEPGVYNVGLQPITAIHLDTTMPAGHEPTSNPQYSYILSGIALLILLIACINFMLLAIGRSAGRALEVGVRKAVGAHRGQLMSQFWGEALLLTVLAVGLGLGLAALAFPTFKTLSGRELALSVGAFEVFALVGLTALVGVAAGSYPALVLARFKPVEVLKGRLRLKGGQQRVQQGMVVIQLALSVLLIVTTLGMRQQLQFLQTTDLGFDKDLAVVIPTRIRGPEADDIVERYRQALAEVPQVRNVAAAWFSMGHGWAEGGYTDENDRYRTFNFNRITPEYLNVLDLELVAGRTFDRASSDDLNRGWIVNEALVREYGWTDAIGKQLPGSRFGDHQIIGVVKDFHFATLHNAVSPVILLADAQPLFDGVENIMFSSSSAPDITVRIAGQDLPGTIDLLRLTWEETVPGEAFDFVFLDEAINSQYRAEERLGTIVGFGTGLSVLVACLGLFGLATLVMTRRTKEIGIRKTLGASASRILVMVSTEFAVLVGIAVAVASPIAYFALHRWLNDFAYQAPIGVGLFVLAGVVTLLVALLAVSYQALRAAHLNPVKALRYE